MGAGTGGCPPTNRAAELDIPGSYCASSQRHTDDEDRKQGARVGKHSVEAPVRSGARKGPRLPGTPNKRAISYGLAKNPGKGERELWAAARKLGVAFDVSPPILHWYPDMVFRPVKLIIEVDGGYHFTGHQVAKDNRKDRELAKRGWKVIRVWADDAKKYPDIVFWGAFTQAFGLGNEEDMMAKCKGQPKAPKPPRTPRPPTVTPFPGKMRKKDLKAILRAQEEARRAEKEAARKARDAAWEAEAADRYVAKIGLRKVVGPSAITLER